MNHALHVELTGDTRDLSQAFRQGLAGLAAFTNRVNTDLGRLSSQTRSHFASMSGAVQQGGQKQQNSFNGIGGGLLKLGAGYFTATAALHLFQQGLSITSDLQRVDAALKAVSTSSYDYARTQSLLRTTADTLGVSYEDLAGAYKGLKAASNGTVLEGKATEKIFLAVTRAGAALKLSSDEVKGSLLAVQQMMSKGNVSAEELRGQLGERLPGAFKLMAQGLGVTEKKLNKMLEQGQVLATDALPKLAEQLEKTYGDKALDNVNTMAGSMTRLTDQTKLFVAEFFQTKGIDTFFAKLTGGMADYIKKLREVGADGLGFSGAAKQQVALRDAGDKQVKTQQQAAIGQFRDSSPAERAVQIRDQQAVTQNARREFEAIQAAEANTGASQKQIDAANFLKEQYRLRNSLVFINKQLIEQEKTRSASPVLLDLDAEKNKYKALETQIQSLELNHKKVPASLRATFAALGKEIERVESSTKTAKPTGNIRVKPEAKSRIDELDTEIKKLEELNEIRKGGDMGVIARLKEAYAEREKENAQIERALQLAKNGDIKPIARKEPTSLATRLNVGFDSKTNKQNLPFLNTNNNLDKQIESIQNQYQQYDFSKFQEQLSKIPTAIRSFAGPIQAASFEAFAGLPEEVRNAQINMVAGLKSITDSLKEWAANDLASGIGETLVNITTGKKNPFAGLIKMLADGFAGLLAQIAKQSIATGTALLLVGLNPIMPNPVLVAQGKSKIASGIGLNVAAGAVRALGSVAFAEGGAVSGSVFANIGEGRGTNKTNPELVIPFQKLPALVTPAITRSLGNFSASLPPPINPRISPAAMQAISGRGQVSSAPTSVNIYGEYELRNDRLFASHQRGQTTQNYYGNSRDQ